MNFPSENSHYKSSDVICLAVCTTPRTACFSKVNDIPTYLIMRGISFIEQWCFRLYYVFCSKAGQNIHKKF